VRKFRIFVRRIFRLAGRPVGYYLAMTTYDLSDVENDLIEYADFEETDSVSRAKLFITAAKRWTIIAAASASNQGSSLSRSKAEVMQMLARAQSFVAAKDTASASASRVRFLSVNEGFR
tara:strand:+ start:8436 stop:8792 length:357 start_codon:yes stop_codon:yes gene_type:complete